MPLSKGDRALRLVNWLGDMRTSDGLILSPVGIETVLGDDFPDTTISDISDLLACRQTPRGWDEI